MYAFCVAEKSWDEVEGRREKGLKLFIVRKRQKIFCMLLQQSQRGFETPPGISQGLVLWFPIF